MPTNEAVKLAAAIRKSAADVAACLVGAQIRTDGHALGQVILDAAGITRLIQAVEPKVVYLAEDVFDLEAELESAREAFGAIGQPALPPEIRAAGRRVAAHDGEVCFAQAALVIDGIVHTAIETADWSDAFEEAVEATTLKLREDAAAGRLAENKLVTAEIESCAVQLAAHPSFNHGSHISFEKRLTLAQAMFGDRDGLQEITKRAQLLFWLEQSGYRSDT
jgi:hypothetical protein